MAQSLIEKLSKIQNELKAPKNQYNDYGKYNYRSCEDILEAVKPLCQKNRTTLVIQDNIVQANDRYYVKAIATLYDWDSENKIETSALARESIEKKGMDSSQITGATSSYARKYALNGLFNIDDTKDADTNQYKQQQDKPSKPKNATRNNGTDVSKERDVKLKTVHDYYTNNPTTFGPVLKGMLNGRKVSELTNDELDGLIEIIETSVHTMEGK